jgi:hypothetical protein
VDAARSNSAELQPAEKPLAKAKKTKKAKGDAKQVGVGLVFFATRYLHFFVSPSLLRASPALLSVYVCLG